MFSLNNKRKASEQTNRLAKQPRGDGFDIEETLDSDEAVIIKPTSQKVTRSASSKKQLRSSKTSNKQKGAPKTKQSARKSAPSKQKVSSKGNDTNEPSPEPEIEHPEQTQLKQASVKITMAQTADEISRGSAEASSTLEPNHNKRMVLAATGPVNTSTNAQNDYREPLVAHQIHTPSQLPAKTANMSRTSMLPLPEADGTTDRDLQRSASSSLQQPPPSPQMALEYQDQHLPRVDRTTLGECGLLWNNILKYREVLLTENITIDTKRNGLPLHVSHCPLSGSGETAIGYLKYEPVSTEMDSGTTNDKLNELAIPHIVEAELVRADLCHLIIPRLIRHVNIVYAQRGIEDSNMKSLRSAAKLLKTLSELCHISTHMEPPVGVVYWSLETPVDDALDQISLFADDIGRALEERVEKLESSRRALQKREEAQRMEIKQRNYKNRQEREAAQIQAREERCKALLEARYAANKKRSDTYWNQDLPESDAILGEILSTDGIDNRLWRRKIGGRTSGYKSFNWTPALTDILTNALIKYQDHDVSYRYEQCLNCEAFSSLTVSEIRRRALEIKPFLEEEWLKMTNSIPRYVWTIK